MYSLSGATRGALRLETPDGDVLSLGKKVNMRSAAIIQVHSEIFWLRVLLFGDIGFAQSYMLQEISAADLTAVLKFFVHNNDAINKAATAGFVSSILGLILKWVPLPYRAINDIGTSHVNAAAHYSLSNDMFEAFLSADMTYSAPMWLPPSDARSEAEPLEEAQLRKLRYAISATRIQPSDRVLEIGTGWGSFAILAARETGCQVTTVTPSAEQKRLAEERIRAAGQEDRIVVVQADYRELGGLGPFDKIVSIEMIEHVGHDFLETYFGCVDRYLKKDGGIGFFQCITIPEARYERYRHSEDFIKKYIFPGGHLPTVTALVEGINQGSKGRLAVEEIKSVGMHYSKALRIWNENFQAEFGSKIAPALQRSHPGMTKLDMDVFKRKWEVSCSRRLSCARTSSTNADPFGHGPVLFLLLRGRF